MKLAAYEAMRANKTEVTMLLDKRLGAGVHAKASDTRMEKTLRSRVVDYESSNDFPPGTGRPPGHLSLPGMSDWDVPHHAFQAISHSNGHLFPSRLSHSNPWGPNWSLTTP